MVKNQTSSGFAKKHTRILCELSERDAMALHPAGDKSVAVILNVGFDTDEDGTPLKIPEMLNVTEWQDFGNGYEVTKLPAGTMNHEDKSIFAAATRELFAETGYVVKDWLFSKAVETSSTRAGERHYKVFLVGKDATKIGEPTESCIRKVNRTPIPEIHKNMTYDQRIGLRASVDLMKCFSQGFGYTLMNHIPVDWIPKN